MSFREAALFTCTMKGCSTATKYRFCDECGDLRDEKLILLDEVDQDIRITKHLYPEKVDTIRALSNTAADLRRELAADTE